MRLKRIGSSLWMIMMLPLQAINAIDKESSDVYLKTVMNELQTFNNPLFHNQYEISSSSDHSHPKISLRNGQKVGGTIHNRYWQTPDYQFDYNQYPGSQISIKKIDNDFLPIATNSQGIVLRPEAINKSWKEDALGLTKIQLAAMYENALQKGSPVGLVPLTTSLSSEKTPRVTYNQLEIPSSPQYSYYFFPLKSFGNELRNNYGYKTIPDNIMQDTKIMETNKEMTNPLFVAVSSFIGMALLFMVGVLLFPKVRNIVPRNQQQDDLILQLTKIVLEAVDNSRNPLMGRSRKNFTRKRNIVRQ